MLCEYGGEINFDPDILRLQTGGTHLGTYIMCLILDMFSKATLWASTAHYHIVNFWRKLLLWLIIQSTAQIKNGLKVNSWSESMC